MNGGLPLRSAAALMGLALASPLAAQDLKVGDPAPPLAIGEWVKGEATTIEAGQVYLVEFWATW